MRGFSRLLYLLIICGLFLPIGAVAETNLNSSVLISEVQTGTAASAGEEFIELYNTLDEPVDISSWKIEYYPATATNFDSPSRSIPLSGLLLPGKYYLLASNDYLVDIANTHYSATLAKSGGHLRLISPDAVAADSWIERDLVGWGTAGLPETFAVLAPDGGESLTRKTDTTGLFINTNNNSEDFEVNIAPSPQSDPTGEPEETPNAPTEPEDPIGEEEQPALEAEENQSPQRTKPALPIQIAELLPNPAAPATDAEDEFVELYNPNDEAVDLRGFKLQTGSTYNYSFVFEGTILPAKSYAAFYVTQTGTLLANSGGKARLLDFDGELQSETAPYSTAKDGQAWILHENKWQWTTNSTPSAANQLTVPAVLGTSKTRKVATTKKAAAKTRTASTKKPTPAAAARAEYDEPDKSDQIAPVHPGVLVLVGALTVIYGVYEYRGDIANKFRQLQRYRAARRATRQTA